MHVLSRSMSVESNLISVACLRPSEYMSGWYVMTCPPYHGELIIHTVTACMTRLDHNYYITA